MGSVKTGLMIDLLCNTKITPMGSTERIVAATKVSVNVNERFVANDAPRILEIFF